MPAPPQRMQQPFDGRTTYHDEYHAKQPEPRGPIAPRPEPGPAVPFDGTTTYGSNFHAHALPERLVAPEVPPRPHVPFDATTTNRDAFVAHELQPRMAPNSAPVHKEHVPFDGTTTNQVRRALAQPFAPVRAGWRRILESHNAWPCLIRAGTAVHSHGLQITGLRLTLCTRPYPCCGQTVAVGRTPILHAPECKPLLLAVQCV
jgi:hypothetical protein